MAACLLLCGAYAAARFDPVRRAAGLRPLVAPAAQTQGGLPLSKEYVYAGGRLVATEEPPAFNPLCPDGSSGRYPKCLVETRYPKRIPSGFSARAVSGTQVSVSWAPPQDGGTADHYVVERRLRAQDPSPYVFNCAASPCADPSAAPWTAYLYRVRTVFSDGNISDYSPPDIATTAVYTGDDPLVGKADPQERPASRVRAADLTEMRKAVDAVRALAEVGVAAWKADPAPQSRGVILAAHFAELRANLNPALSALGMAALPDDATLGAGLPVKAAHVQDVREKVR